VAAVTKSTGVGRGGQRTKTGGKTGNLNAAKHMRDSRDPVISGVARLLPKRAAVRLAERLKARDPEAWREIADVAAQWALDQAGLTVVEPTRPAPFETVAGHPKISIYRHEPSISLPPPPQPQRSDGQALGDVLDDMIRWAAEWGFRPAPRRWVKLHREAVEHMKNYRGILDDMDEEQLREFLREFPDPMRWWNGMVHMEIALEVEDELHCPYRPLCRWAREGRQLPLKEAK
jgi:hypothetical protein